MKGGVFTAALVAVVMASGAGVGLAEAAAGQEWVLLGQDINGSAAGDSDGFQGLKLRPGPAGRSRLSIKAGGANMPTPAPHSSFQFFAFNPTVRVQMHSSTGTCLESLFDDPPFKNTGEKFKTKRKVRVVSP